MIWAAAISAWAPFRGGPSAPPRQRSHPLCKAPAGDDGAAQSSPVKEESKVRSLQDLLGAVESARLQQQQGAGLPPFVERERPPKAAAPPPPPPPPPPAPPQHAASPPPSATAVAAPPTEAWVILSKHPVRDQLTLEQALRVHTAIRMLAADDAPRPAVIVFCGSATRRSELDDSEEKMLPLTSMEDRRRAPLADHQQVTGASLAYSFFRSCVEAQRIDLSATELLLHRESGRLRDGLVTATLGVRRRMSRDDDGGGLVVRLFSTAHILQRLRDYDAFSPRRSPLRPLREMRAEVRWEPVSYPYSYSSEATTWRRARHIVLAEQLQVLRLNLNGMLEGAGQAEFLQPENYRRLKTIHATLAEELRADVAPRPQRPHALEEHLTEHRPLGARREATAAAHAAPRYNAEQMVVEQAAARLGKLQVLLKPLADDPIHGMMKIPAAELRDAAELLGSVVDGLRQADPDRPIKPDEWLRLLSSVEEERFIASSLLATTARRTT